jgi:asparagine synthase (glutamine-hydrolysing)
MLYVDTKTWLPDKLLVKADKITMGNSLELRVPLLDHKVLEFAASLHPSHKVQGRDTKRVLKAAFSKVLPREIVHRKKAGFPVPFASWLENELADRAKEILLDDSTLRRGYFQKKPLERLIGKSKVSQDWSDQVFSLLVLEFWHREFGDSLPS